MFLLNILVSLLEQCADVTGEEGEVLQFCHNVQINFEDVRQS